MTHIICIANQKGGVGKTTTAINLSAALAASGRETLLVDCDPQANATTGLGIEKSSLQKGCYDLLMGNGEGKDVWVPTGLSGMSLIGATADLVGVEVEMHSFADKELRLRNGIEEFRQFYDFIFLDCPPSLGFLTVNALTASHSVLIPLQCEYYALEGLSQLVNTIKAVKMRLNPVLKIERILLTMFDQRNNLSQQVADDVRTHFKDKVFKVVIPRNVRLSEAPSHGQPIMLYDIRSKGAQSYLALAKELIGKD